MAGRNATAILVGALSLVVGFALGSYFARPRSTGRNPDVSPAPAPSTEMIEVLREIRATLAELASTRALLPVSPANQHNSAPTVAIERTPATESAQSSEFAGALQDLAGALDRLGRAGPGSSPARPRELIFPVRVAREAAFESTGMRAAATLANDDAYEAALNAFRRQHLLWTDQQVLDVYGRPDRVEANGDSTVWHYDSMVGREITESFTFYFNRGAVFDVDYDRD
jgi:hypothetical protein